MTLLTCDLGVRSGLAVMSLDGNVLTYDTVYVESLYQRLVSLSHSYGITHFVVERPIIYRGHLGEELAVGMSTVEMVNLKPFYIEANWWKSHPLARQKVPGDCTAHERDAIRMGWVYLRREVAGT